MIRVGFSSVPGSGKTSTARALSAFCKKDETLKHVELVSEYARRYITKYGSIQSVADQYRILEKQVDWESSISLKTDLLITDSPIFLGWLYVLEYKKEDIKDVMFVNDIFKKMNKLNFPPRYDIIFHLPPILKPVDDGVRAEVHFDDTWRNSSNEILKYIFKMFPPKKFIEIESVDLMDRVKECMDHISKYIKGE